MKRLHVHVCVDNLADSIKFYSGMFAAQPSVTKGDYAKWMLDDPRVNFAISQRGAALGINHLGVQVESASELEEMQSRLKSLLPGVEKDEGVSCCYAKSDKYWVTDPSGITWETFQTLGTIPVFGEPRKDKTDSVACCVPINKSPVNAATAACNTPPSTSTSTTSCC